MRSPSALELGITRARQILKRAQQTESESALVALTIELARELLDASHAAAEPSEQRRAELMARLLEDSSGQAFVAAITDRAHRSAVGARLVEQIKDLVRRLGIPRSFSALDRLELRALQWFGTAAPELTARSVRSRIYQDAAPYLAPADLPGLRRFLSSRRAQGLRVNVNHLGEEVLGDTDAERYLETYVALLARPEVDTISVKLSSIDARIDAVAWEQTLERLSNKLRRIYQAAIEHSTTTDSGMSRPKLVYLDMEAYRDLELTVELFTRTLSNPELSGLSAGLVLQAYIPDSHGVQQRLVRWARARVDRGGAPVRLRIVKGANLMMERIEASLRDWPLAPYASKPEVDASFRHMLRYGARPENAACVHLGVGTHNLFDIAYTLLLREQQEVSAWVEPEMLEGMADPLRRVVQHLAGSVLVYAPSVDRQDFPSAVAYLVRRLDENTAEQNFLRHSFTMQSGDARFDSERSHFIEAMTAVESVDTRTHRTQARQGQTPAAPTPGFHNEPDTDFSLAKNRGWLVSELERAKKSDHGSLCSQVAGVRLDGAPRDGFDPSRPGAVPYRYEVLDGAGVERALQLAARGQRAWAGTPAERREATLLGVAAELRRARGELIGLVVLDAGKRAVEADAEVSEAIDFAEYYAYQHARLRERFELAAKGLVVVTPPWNFPLSIGLGSVLAALVTGNAVLLKPPPETPLVLARAVALCWQAGVPAEALGLVLAEDEAATPLITDPRVSAVMLTGGTETARLFRRLRPGLDLIAETGGKNAAIVSAVSDRDQAIANAARSAFGHAGQKCSALSLLVLEREVYRSASFRRKLADRVASLAVGSAWDLESIVTPLIRPPSGPLERALTHLDDGESWLVQPTRSQDNPRLVGPSVRWNVQRGSFVQQTELFGPILSVLEAKDFEHALQLANATPYGLTAGLETLDLREQALFLDRMQAGNLYLNKPVTGAIVGRQPFGGQKASSFGSGYKAGGPNALLALVRITAERATPARTRPISCGPRSSTELDSSAVVEGQSALDRGPLAEIIDQLSSDASAPARQILGERLESYERSLREEFGVEHPQDQVLGYRDVFVYRPCHVGLLVLSGSNEIDLVSSLLAAHWTRARVDIFADERLTSTLFHRLLTSAKLRFEAISEVTPLLAAGSYDRLRVLGANAQVELAIDPADLNLLLESCTSVELLPVHDSGYVELRRYMVEQSRSLTLHRYGNLSLSTALERPRGNSQLQRPRGSS